MDINKAFKAQTKTCFPASNAEPLIALMYSSGRL
jgi:hypothetical protein